MWFVFRGWAIRFVFRGWVIRFVFRGWVIRFVFRTGWCTDSRKCKRRTKVTTTYTVEL